MNYNTSSGRNTVNRSNTSKLGSSISSGKIGIISSKAKVIILRPNSTPKTEGIYEFQVADKESTLNPPEDASEDFQRLGKIIGVTEYLIEISSLNVIYNYELEIRNGGILIKPKNSESFDYAELNKTTVIDKAIGVVQEDFGIPSFQIKTIVIDLLTSIAQN